MFPGPLGSRNPTEADGLCAHDLRFKPSMKMAGENLARKTVSSSRLLVTEVEFEVDMVPSDGTCLRGGGRVISHLLEGASSRKFAKIPQETTLKIDPVAEICGTHQIGSTIQLAIY